MADKEILIVEDDPVFRRSIKFALKGEGYAISEADSVSEGVSKLFKNPIIQVILLDLSLPDGTGKDFLELVKDRTPAHRVIILTGFEEKLAAKQAEEYGVFYYLPKAERSFTQSIRFSVGQAFKDVEIESLKEERERWIREKGHLIKKTEDLIKIQRKINDDRPLDEILDLICESVLQLVGAYTCHVRLYNLKTGDFDLVSFAGPAGEIRTIFDGPKRKGDFFSGKVAETKSPYLSGDLQNDKDFQAFREKLLKTRSLPEDAKTYLGTVQSAYIVPITTNMFSDETDAIFNVGADSPDFFSEQRREIINEFVAQATIAITKAWLKQKKVETHEDYRGISGVLEEITRKLSEENIREEVYGTVLEGISRIVRPETISILLHNKAADLLDTVAEQRGGERKTPCQVGHPKDEGLTGWVFTNSEPLRMPNLQREDRRKPQQHPSYSEDLETDYVRDIPSERVEHYLGVPMQIGGETTGVIQLLNKKSEYYDKEENKHLWLLERGFSDDCENVLGIAVSYLAVAMKNADLIEERNRKIRQLDTLKGVGRYTSSEMPLDELLDKIIKEAAEDVEAEICLLFLLNEDKDRVVFEQSYGIPREKLKGKAYEIGEGLTGGVAETGQSILKKAGQPDGKCDEEILSHLQQTHRKDKTIESLMVVPIKVKNETIGVIKAINKKGDIEQYDQEDLSFFETFATYVGIAIENTRRYTVTNEKLAIAEKNVALSHLVRAVVHEINNTKTLIPINVELIRERISTSNYDLEEMLKVIENSADRAVRFANSIQAFSVSRLGKRKPHDINVIIRTAVGELAPSFELDNKHSQVTLKQTLSSDALMCSVYEAPFIQVIQNMIINAYHAMENSKEKVLNIISYEDAENNLAKIELTDTGHGIDSETLEKIFDPEFTTKSRGTGIGLWLAQTHLDSIDAEIKVTSVEGKGTTFTIEVPVAEAGLPEEIDEQPS
ncbi:MAG TPA: GAF domain-containing protein [Pyrinomonadaceae bacterium]|nr:GAF domain-containing protein [Pyrinomonadaceae bacterium]